MNSKAFEAYLNSNNCSVDGKKSFTAVRNDDPSKTATYSVSGPNVDAADVQRVCSQLGIPVPAL